MKQKTLKGSFSLFGKGLHTGLNLTVTFNPAPENTGYKIQRIDLEGEPVIDAIAETHPLRVVFRDSSFTEAAQKMNLFELFKQKCGWTDQEVQNNVRVI